jgi:hypothetical protein
MADLQAQTSVQGPEARLAQLSQASRNYIRSESASKPGIGYAFMIVSEGLRGVRLWSGWIS